MNDTLESYSFHNISMILTVTHNSFDMTSTASCRYIASVDVLITLNKRLDTAAAAMVHNMINRKRPLVFRPVSPFKKGSIGVVAMMRNVRKDNA